MHTCRYYCRFNRPYLHNLLTISNYVNCPSNFAVARLIYLFHPPIFEKILIRIRSIITARLLVRENFSSTYLSLPEFGSLVESVLENTLLNILKEANSRELNITAPLYTIAKPVS